MIVPGHCGTVIAAADGLDAEARLLADLKTGPGFCYVRDCNGECEPGIEKESAPEMYAHLEALGWIRVTGERGNAWGPATSIWTHPDCPPRPARMSPECAEYLARRKAGLPCPL